jgi:Fe-S-cluster-containing dehydrogenase component
MQWQLKPEMTFNRLEFFENGKFPNAKQEIIPLQCQHCDNAPCISVCPTGANNKRTDGIVSIEEKKCIGCKYCMIVCPYNARKFDKDSHVPDKCRFCAEVVEEGGIPYCVTTCMNKVRIFGDMDDPDSEISKLLNEENYQLLLGEQTRPRIYYKKRNK